MILIVLDSCLLISIKLVMLILLIEGSREFYSVIILMVSYSLFKLLSFCLSRKQQECSNFYESVRMGVNSNVVHIFPADIGDDLRDLDSAEAAERERAVELEVV